MCTYQIFIFINLLTLSKNFMLHSHEACGWKVIFFKDVIVKHFQKYVKVYMFDSSLNDVITESDLKFQQWRIERLKNVAFSSGNFLKKI